MILAEERQEEMIVEWRDVVIDTLSRIAIDCAEAATHGYGISVAKNPYVLKVYH